MSKALFTLLCMLGQLVLLSACNGIMGGIYDEAPEEERTEYGFVKHDESTGRGRLYLEVVSYKKWVYIDLHKRKIQSINIPEGLSGQWDGKSGVSYMQVTWPSTFERKELIRTDAMPSPSQWDFALHHYDVRTHRGAALETHYSSIDELLRQGNRAELLGQTFVKDIWSDHWAYQDLTGIFNYYIGYHNTEYNPVLSRWMDMRVQNPPPTYHPSGKVYLLRLQDGSVAALHFSNYMSPAGVKGYVSIDYVYPY